ncbi:MAG: response regulator, partial [Candidatus Binataceae bacterium]
MLLVDDDADVVEALTDILDGEGYEVEPANDGLSALVYLESHELPDIMILDLFMPNMNGWDLLRALRNNREWAKIPIIVVSAFAHAQEVEAVADAVLSKPVDLDALLDSMSVMAAAH